MTAVCSPSAEAVPRRRYREINGASQTVTGQGHEQVHVYRLPRVEFSAATFDNVLRQLKAQPWYKAILEQLEEYSTYEEGWDGYSAKRIDGRAMGQAAWVLAAVGSGGPEPVVAPLSSGGLQVEWYYGGTEIEVEIPPSGPIAILWETPDGDVRDETARPFSNAPIWSDLSAVITGLV